MSQPHERWRPLVHLRGDTSARRGHRETELLSRTKIQAKSFPGSALLGVKGPAHPQSRELPGLVLVLRPSPREWLPAARGVSCPQAPGEDPYDALVSSVARAKKAERRMTGASSWHMEKQDFSRALRSLLPDGKIGSLSRSQIHICRPDQDTGECLGWKNCELLTREIFHIARGLFLWWKAWKKRAAKPVLAA